MYKRISLSKNGRVKRGRKLRNQREVSYKVAFAANLPLVEEEEIILRVKY